MRTLRNIVFLDLETKVKTLYFEIMSTVVKILTRHMDLLHELCGLDTLSTLQWELIMVSLYLPVYCSLDNKTFSVSFQLYRRICCKGPSPVRPNFTILCIGLENAGKSSVLATLSGDDLHKIEPTIGMEIEIYLYISILSTLFVCLSTLSSTTKKPRFMILCFQATRSVLPNMQISFF